MIMTWNVDKKYKINNTKTDLFCSKSKTQSHPKKQRNPV